MQTIYKLAFFDFCDTLVGFQTADAFVDFVRKENGNSYMRFLNAILIGFTKLKVIAIINKLYPGAVFGKRLKLLQLRNIRYEKLDYLASRYYSELIRPNLIVPVLSEMQRLYQNSFEICIVSAGYSLYLKYFALDNHIKFILSTEIAFSKVDKRCLGTIRGKDCIENEKVRRIKAAFNNCNFNESISFSDSISDLPMLQLTGTAVVVSHNNSQPWNTQYKFKEIIWNYN
jgi:HAD superfamily phosphoserine phosphatase-like hydrolase